MKIPFLLCDQVTKWCIDCWEYAKEQVNTPTSTTLLLLLAACGEKAIHLLSRWVCPMGNVFFCFFFNIYTKSLTSMAIVPYLSAEVWMMNFSHSIPKAKNRMSFLFLGGSLQQQKATTMTVMAILPVVCLLLRSILSFGSLSPCRRYIIQQEEEEEEETISRRRKNKQTRFELAAERIKWQDILHTVRQQGCHPKNI